MAAADPLESISIAARTTASQREELVRRISAVERELEEERARGKLARERARELTATTAKLGVEVPSGLGEGGGARASGGGTHHHRSSHGKHRHRRRRRHGEDRHKSRRRREREADLTSRLTSSGGSVLRKPPPPRPAAVPELGTTDANMSKTTTFMRDKINGRQVKHLLYDPSVKTVNVFQTTSGTDAAHGPESVRDAIGHDWELRAGRHQTELTRYVDVVLRQGMSPFVSTALGGI